METEKDIGSCERIGFFKNLKTSFKKYERKQTAENENRFIRLIHRSLTGTNTLRQSGPVYLYK